MSPDDLNPVLQRLETLAAEAEQTFSRVASSEEVEQARITFLGQKHGRLEEFEAFFKSLPPDGKKAFGRRFNELKNALKQAHQAAKERVGAPGAMAVQPPQGKGPAGVQEIAKGAVDFSLPGLRTQLGRKHPLTQTAEELIDIFGRFGFTLATGPEVEDEWHNFEALNIPPAHPARDPLDNFYIHPGAAGLLRSQTSTVQIRV